MTVPDLVNMRYYDPAYKFEKDFWGDCTNTFGEETKQYVYARLMGLKMVDWRLDVEHKRILDIGGGPTALLLKTVNLAGGRVCDPIQYPDWVYARYSAKNIGYVVRRGEDLDESGWDEVWIYNVLQHTIDPKKILQNALRAAPVLRLFEWLDFPPHPGHPWMLTEADMTRWLGRKGLVVQLAHDGCFGKSFSGIFGAKQEGGQ